MIHLEFKPHSWYMNTAIKDDRKLAAHNGGMEYRWYAVAVNGMTGYLVEFESNTLRDLKKQIKNYWSK